MDGEHGQRMDVNVLCRSWGRSLEVWFESGSKCLVAWIDSCFRGWGWLRCCGEAAIACLQL